MKTARKPQIQVASDSLIRQLNWCVTSPPLVSDSATNIWPGAHWYEQQREQLQPLLDSLAPHADALHDFINSERDVRLGARFERMLEFWMEQHPAIDVLARRLQYAQEGRTFGEFDFLVQTSLGVETRADDPTDVTHNSHLNAPVEHWSSEHWPCEHWEVACKFYLGVPVNNVMHWVGPGKRDRLVRKLERIQSHQLMLSNREGARSMLSERGIRVDATKGLLKGRLFYPLPDVAKQNESAAEPPCESLPGGLNLHAAHERGFWCEVSHPVLADATSIVLLPKNLWLDPQRQVDGEQLAQAALGELCENAPQCCDIQCADGVGMRMFVVAPGWFNDVSELLGRI